MGSSSRSCTASHAVYNAAGDLKNHYPSDYLNSDGTPGGDHGLFDRLVGSGMAANDPRFANSAAFSQYILGPDGVLRGLNKSDGKITQSQFAGTFDAKQIKWNWIDEKAVLVVKRGL